MGKYPGSLALALVAGQFRRLAAGLVVEELMLLPLYD
jgi:hypothetical protein